MTGCDVHTSQTHDVKWNKFWLVKTRTYYVYILASKSRVLYVGITGFIMPRVLQHKQGEGGLFSSSYRVNRLVYYESYQQVEAAIRRETEIKKWRREKKIALILKENPTWDDLAKDWGKRVSMTYRPVR